ncbi:MAG: hypothetical protein WB778_09120 [Thermoplasmata archaeon]
MAAASQEQFAQMVASAKPVDFEVIGGKDPEVRIRVDDGGHEAVLRIKVVIASVNRVGNDPNSGLPAYQVNSQIVMGILKSYPRLKRASMFKATSEPSKGIA